MSVNFAFETLRENLFFPFIHHSIVQLFQLVCGESSTRRSFLFFTLIYLHSLCIGLPRFFFLYPSLTLYGCHLSLLQSFLEITYSFSSVYGCFTSEVSSNPARDVNVTLMGRLQFNLFQPAQRSPNWVSLDLYWVTVFRHFESRYAPRKSHNS